MDACDTLVGDRSRSRARRAARLPHRAAGPRGAHRARSPARCTPRSSSGSPAAGIDGLWTHQAAAIDALHDGRHVVVATGTASGKSLCYQLPIVDVGRAGRARHRAARSSRPRRSPRTSCGRCGRGSSRACSAVTYDGDTPPDDRAWARKNANVVLTNPEMLHLGILPSHQRWATFLMRLRYVVVDELHTLRGIFGSHVAHVLRRLRRVCEHYGVEPVVLLRERDDRQPGRARVRAVRAAGRRDRRRRLARSPSAASRSGSGRCSTSTPGAASSANVETAELLAALRARRPTDARVHAQPPRRRARRARRRAAGSSADDPELARPRRRVPRRLPAPRSAASSRTQLATGSCSASRPRTRSSSASTSAGSTRSCSTASPARSRRCGSRSGRGRAHRPARRGGARRRRRPARPVVRRASRPSCSAARPKPAVVNPDEPVRARGRRSRARRTSCRSTRATSAGSATASTTRCASSCSTTSSSRATGACTGPGASRRRRGSGCAPARRSSTGSSAGRRRRRPPHRHRRLEPGRSTSRTRARSTCTRAGSTGSTASTSTTTSPCSSRPTTPTSTPRPARTPTSRSSSEDAAGAVRRRAGRTSARSR